MPLRFLSRKGKKQKQRPSSSLQSATTGSEAASGRHESLSASAGISNSGRNIDDGINNSSQGSPTTGARAASGRQENFSPSLGNLGKGLMPALLSRSSSNNVTKNVIYKVQIPPDTKPNEEFQVKVKSRMVRIRCPKNALPGQYLQISIPDDPAPASPPQQSTSQSSSSSSVAQGESFLVIIPDGVQPGDPFALVVGGMRFTITCPKNASGGKRIRFHLPPHYCRHLNRTKRNGKTSVNDNGHNGEDVQTSRLDYDVEGWARTLLLTDDGGKFKWARVHNQDQKPGNQDDWITTRLHQNAYVRRITPDGVDLAPACDVLIESTVVSMYNNRSRSNKNPVILASCTDLIRIQSRPLAEKVSWFRSICSQLYRPPNSPSDTYKNNLHIHIRRQHLLQDSMTFVLSMSPQDLHRTWRINFVGEEGIDGGGLTREWFHLISTTLLDVDAGCWCTARGGGKQSHLQIHPSYALSSAGESEEECRLYYRFLGRVIGKALVGSQLLSDGHFVPYLYKMMLGWPITFSDLQPLDVEYYNSLLQLLKIVDDGGSIEDLCLDFTVVEDVMGVVNVVELKPNGKDIELTADNLLNFLELVLEYRLVRRVEEPLRALLLGFHDVVPESLLAVFDFQELELMLCGLPDINVKDWRENTEYSGVYDVEGIHPVCQWFWTVVEEMDVECRARLLQFVTGTSGVPAKGFRALQGSDGDIRRFSIHSASLEECLYPRAHTCFNRIDLPVYKTMEDLREKLTTAITLVSTGFDLE